MPMNGGDWRSGPIPHGGTREEGMGVPTGAWATILPRVANGKKTANQKEEQETSKEKRKQRGNSQTKALTTVGLQYQANSQKEQSRKRKNRTKPAETTRATNTANTSNKNSNMLFSLKRNKKRSKNAEQKRNTRPIHIQWLYNRFSRGKRE